MENRITQVHNRLKAEGKPIINLVSGLPNAHGFKFPPEILAREYERYFAVQDYQPDPKGELEAREAIRSYYAAAGCPFAADRIILTSGTSESYLHAFATLAEPGDNFLVPNPSYPLLGEIARLARVELKTYPLDESKGWAIDLKALEREIDIDTRGIVLVSPNNPTGAVPTAPEIHGVAELARQNELAILSDEVFGDFLFEGEALPRPCRDPSAPLVITLNGISKMFALPAMKLGWMALSGDPERVNTAVDQLETMTDALLAAHMPIQKALPALFKEGGSFREGYIKEVGARRDLAVKILSRSPRLKLHPPQGGFYLTVAVQPPHRLSEEELVVRLLEEAGVLVHPGYFFDYEQGLHLVISFLARPEELTEGLNRLVRFVAEV